MQADNVGLQQRLAAALNALEASKRPSTASPINAQVEKERDTVRQSLQEQLTGVQRELGTLRAERDAMHDEQRRLQNRLSDETQRADAAAKV